MHKGKVTAAPTASVMRQGGGDQKTKKSDMEDLQKANAPMARALSEKYMIILPDFTKANTCNRPLFGKYG